MINRLYMRQAQLTLGLSRFGPLIVASLTPSTGTVAEATSWIDGYGAHVWNDVQ